MNGTPGVGGWVHQTGGHLNFGGMGNNPISSGLMSLLGQAAQSQLFSSRGFTPNQFQGTQSFFDQQLSNQFAQQQLAAVQEAARRDREMMQKAMTGSSTHNLLAKNKVMDLVQSLAVQGSYINPDLIDQLHGSTGSSAVMAHHTVGGLRYMRDRHGQEFDLKNAGDFTARLHERLYGQDPKDMNGIGAGRAGQMFDEMARRGIMQSPADVEQVSGKLQDMSKAVSAVRDLFGANGKTNAPMKELFDGLNALTQGGANFMSGSDSSMMVRRVQSLSRNVQGGLDRYMMLSRQGGALADMAGMDRAFGAQTATSSMAFGKAFGQLAGNQGFGGLTMDDATALDQQLRTTAAGSDNANVLGGFLDMSEQGMFRDPTSDAAKLAADLRSKDPAARQRAMAWMSRVPPNQLRSQLQAMTQAAGVSSSTTSTFFNAGAANQASVFRHGLGDMVRDMQGGGEIATLTNAAFQSGMMGAFGEAGFSNAETQQLLPMAAEAIRQTMAQMDGDLISNPERSQERNQLLTQAVVQAIGPQNAARLGPKINELVGSAVKSLDSKIARDPNLRKFKNTAGLFTVNSERVKNAGKQEINRADEEGKKASVSAGTGSENRQSVIQRLADSIAGRDDQTSILDILGSALGGVDKREAALAALFPRGAQGAGANPAAGPQGARSAITINGTLTINADGTVTINAAEPNNAGSAAAP